MKSFVLEIHLKDIIENQDIIISMLILLNKFDVLKYIYETYNKELSKENKNKIQQILSKNNI